MKVVLLLFFINRIPRSNDLVEELVPGLFLVLSFWCDVCEPSVSCPDVSWVATQGHVALGGKTVVLVKEKKIKI